MSQGQRPPRWVIAVGLIVLAAMAGLLSRKYTSDGARECLALYRAAHNAADRARVDTTVTAGSRRERDPHTCGFMRTSARWR